MQGWLARRVYQQIDDLYESVQDLKRMFPEGCPQDIETVSTSLHYIRDSMPKDRLPHYEEAHSLRAPINSCLGFLQVERLLAPREGRPLTAEQSHRIDAAIHLTRQFMYDFYQLCYRDQYAWFVDVHTEHAPEPGPLFITHLLAWPYLLKHIDGFTLTLPKKLSFPPVLYHPHYTPILWDHLLMRFHLQWRDERVVLITPQAEQQGIALRITKRDLQMTPARWADLFNPRWESGFYEPLYELGGDIEPLTRDEGMGQGVIVRLPWTNRSS